MDSIYLLLLSIVLLLIELATVSLTTIWFAIGAFASCLVALVVDNFVIEGIVFIVVSLVTLFAFRPSIMKKFNSKRHKTNADSLIGCIATVTEDIDNIKFTGTAVLNGQEWTARAKDDKQIIKAGMDVEVVEISGVKLIVIEK